jgi:hypothetical protein
VKTSVVSQLVLMMIMIMAHDKLVAPRHFDRFGGLTGSVVEHVNPAIIYKSASSSIQDSWLPAFEPNNHRAFFASSPSGWTNNDIGLAWLKQVFDHSQRRRLDRAIDCYSWMAMDLTYQWILSTTAIRTGSSYWDRCCVRVVIDG